MQLSPAIALHIDRDLASVFVDGTNSLKKISPNYN